MASEPPLPFVPEPIPHLHGDLRPKVWAACELLEGECACRPYQICCDELFQLFRRHLK